MSYECILKTLYVNVNFTARDVLSKTKQLLSDIGPNKPRDFKITLKPNPPDK